MVASPTRAAIEAALALLVPQQCLDKYFPTGSLLAPEFAALLDGPCLKLVISKVLGYGIVAGSALVKMPQIMKIVNAGSVAGLSGIATNIEMLSSTCSLAYYAGLGYPFSTWGENFFLFTQNVVVVSLYFGYSRGSFFSPSYLFFMASLAALGSSLYLRALPPVDLPPAACASLGLKSCTLTAEGIAGGLPIVLLLFSRLPQIWQNVSQGHTGVLAMPTFALNTLGGLARVFTILQELSDPIALGGAISGFLQNLIIVIQIIVYRKANRERAAAEKAKSEKKTK